tara:strand:- start:3 stop:284 length:282 start_codon:yes stop_codon:yes gene_type:complete
MSEFYLTDNQADAYGIGVCPFCKSPNSEVNVMGDSKVEQKRILIYTNCANCHQNFTARFALKSISYFKGEKECLEESEKINQDSLKILKTQKK